MAADLDGRPDAVSTATAFKYHRPFPFCVTDISGSEPAGVSYVGNLTLTQVMAFGWNLKTLTISTSGSASRTTFTSDANSSFTLNPVAGTLFTEGYAGGMMVEPMAGHTAFASWPAPRTPRERVCYNVADGSGMLYISLRIPPTTFDEATGFITFILGTDPSNAGKYRIYYNFDFRFVSDPLAYAQMMFNNISLPSFYTAITSGTITISGISFNWFSAYYGTSYTGGTMSATSSDFTY